jgi:hypothetical protein
MHAPLPRKGKGYRRRDVRRHLEGHYPSTPFSDGKLRIETLGISGWEIAQRGRFATPTDFPLQDSSPYSHVHARRGSLGVVPRSRTISYRPAKPSITIRNRCIAVGGARGREHPHLLQHALRDAGV